MKSKLTTGFYLFSKTQATDNALKPMLQYLRSHSPGRTLQFAYVESETSLLPHLTLWENIHVVVGGSTWKEFTTQLEIDWQPLINLIRDPHMKAGEASCWEKLTTSLLKATLIQSQHILIDINEADHSTLNLMNFKKMLNNIAQKKNVFVATSAPALWLDSAHAMITKEEYKFVVKELTTDTLKTQKIA
jgi:hypothetical protein